MIVAVESGLDSVREALSAQGHEVVALENSTSFHAAVYVSRNIADISVPKASAKNAMFGSGIFLVNARGRTPEEICAIISQKAYGKLF